MRSIFIRQAVFAAACFVGCGQLSAEILDGLLVVDSGTNRVLYLDAFDGRILNPALIEDSALQTPVNAISSGRGTLLLSDQLLDEVREYSLSGAYLRTIVNSTQVDNIRGIAVRNDGLYVTVAGSGAGTDKLDTVQRFNLDGTNQSTFIATNGGTSAPVLGSPWDVTFRENDVLVSDSVTDRVERFDLSGQYLGAFSPSTIAFPQQINLETDGDVLVGNNTGGIVRFSEAGVFDVAFGPTSARGVIQLGDGRYLFGSGINLGIFDPLTNQTEFLISENGRSFRYIERVTAIPEPGAWASLSIALIGFVGWLGVRRRRATNEVLSAASRA